MVRHAALALSLAALVCGGASAAAPRLSQPLIGDVLPLADGRLVVSDFGQGAVFVVDPARRTGRRAASVAQARELERLPDGRVLVTSGANVVAADLRTGRTQRYARAAAPLLGIARSGSTLYGSEAGKTVVRLRPGPRTVLARGLDGVHGITVQPGALVLAESYAGRVLRLDLATRDVEVLAEGLGNPSFTLPAAGGGFYVSEFAGGRISHLHPDGTVTKFATVTQPGPIAFDPRHRIVGITFGGTIFRVEGGRARTIYR
jgi:DNA-binding beta-propeller fold protein YncE